MRYPHLKPPIEAHPPLHMVSRQFLKSINPEAPESLRTYFENLEQDVKHSPLRVKSKHYSRLTAEVIHGAEVFIVAEASLESHARGQPKTVVKIEFLDDGRVAFKGKPWGPLQEAEQKYGEQLSWQRACCALSQHFRPN